ncbi:MAG: ABC transporter permease subunit [Gammaproteobacteria bacterium]
MSTQSARVLLTVAQATAREAISARLLWPVLAVLTALFALTEFVGETAITESTETKAALFGASMRVFAVVFVALFVSTSMLRELNDKGFELLLALAISRSVYYFGKWLGYSLVAVTLAMIVAGCLVLYAPPVQVAIWGGSLACELLIVAAASLLCLFTLSQVTSALSSVLAFYFLARVIDAVQLMGAHPVAATGALGQRVLAIVVDLLAYLLPDLYRYTRSQWLMYHTAAWPDLLPIAGQTAVYLTLLVAAGLFDLYRKNL